jgi:hypothetical protein
LVKQHAVEVAGCPTDRLVKMDCDHCGTNVPLACDGVIVLNEVPVTKVP